MFNFLKNSSAKLLESVFAKAEEVVYQRGDLLAEQFSKSKYLFILQEGEVTYYSNFQGSSRRIEIGQFSTPNSPLGLDAMSEPYRHESSIEVNSEMVRVLRWERTSLQSFLDKNIEAAIEFYEYVNIHALNLMEEASYLFMNTTFASKSKGLPAKESEGYDSPMGFDAKELVIFLLQSPFFEVFEEEDLVVLSKSVVRRQYKVGNVIDLQDMKSGGVNILRVGEVRFSRYNGEGDDQTKVTLRSISTPGYLTGPSGLLDAKNVLTTKAKKDTVIFHIPSEAIKSLCKKRPEFALNLQIRTTWFINNHLRALRARLISAQFDEEVTVSTSLIESNRASLSLSSPLHKVPHLLSFKHTIPDGIGILHFVELNGDGIEKNIASLCLDNLHDTQREMEFYQDLQTIFDAVVSAPAIMMQDKVHRESIRLSKEAFSRVTTFVKGVENIPEQPGHLFIYNHLLNPPYYALPNQFQINLDCHFLSMIISDAYNPEVGMKIVRSGREMEHDHQNYYERLGYINAYLDHASTEVENESNERVSEQIEEFLSEFNNVIIGPEHTSYTTEQSPGLFESEVFERVLEMEREPLIVPVVMANFDRRIRKNKFAVEIKKPFLLSEKMANVGVDDVGVFLDQFRLQYKSYIQDLVKESH
ncbi:MAG: cyclic nucleotide-binding domain-containing protein [Reichenbachiella sp.]